MQYRPLGHTGLTVSEIGFGAWGIGGPSHDAAAYGPTDDRESLRALRRAFELGVTFYDTAALYGYGHSEELIGEAFKDTRSQVVIASKVGRVDAAGRQNFSPAHLRASLAASLRRLRTDYLDVYQLHDPSIEWLEQADESLETLAALQREGYLRAVGISCRSPQEAVEMSERFGVRCVQVNFNLVDQRALACGLLERCGQLGVGVIVRTPLCFGFLTGAYASDSVFERGDHRTQWSAEQRAVWARAPQQFASLLARRRQSPAQLALRFCLSYSSLSTTIPGMLTVQHVEENVAASQLGPLPSEERAAIEQIYRQHAFFVESRGHSRLLKTADMGARDGANNMMERGV